MFASSVSFSLIFLSSVSFFFFFLSSVSLFLSFANFSLIFIWSSHTSLGDKGLKTTFLSRYMKEILLVKPSWMALMSYCHSFPKRIWLASIWTKSHNILSWYFLMEKDTSTYCFTWTSSPSLSHWSLYGLGCGLVSMFIFDTNLELTTLSQIPPSMITKNTLPLIEHLVWKIFSFEMHPPNHVQLSFISFQLSITLFFLSITIIIMTCVLLIILTKNILLCRTLIGIMSHAQTFKTFHFFSPFWWMFRFLLNYFSFVRNNCLTRGGNTFFLYCIPQVWRIEIGITLSCYTLSFNLSL